MALNQVLRFLKCFNILSLKCFNILSLPNAEMSTSLCFLCKIIQTIIEFFLFFIHLEYIKQIEEAKK